MTTNGMSLFLCGREAGSRLPNSEEMTFKRLFLYWHRDHNPWERRWDTVIQRRGVEIDTP